MTPATRRLDAHDTPARREASRHDDGGETAAGRVGDLGVDGGGSGGVAAHDGGIADLARLADHLWIVDDPDLAPADRAQLAIAWLSECDQTWLIVLDNIGSAEQPRDLLPRTQPGA